TGVQVLGGAGYVEASGAPQDFRDVRVTAIYEGTNGIQANDLVRRKVAREEGATAKALIAAMREIDGPLAGAGNDDAAAIRDALGRGIDALEDATDWIVRTHQDNAAAVDAGAVPYLRLLGTVAGGWMMARAALAASGRLAQGGDGAFAKDKLVSARFYADQVLVQAPALAATVTRGWEAVGRFGEEA
ncbi:MAG: acyl-CoA dehydrogenase, partial [Rhodospirillales bacterium]